MNTNGSGRKSPRIAGPWADPAPRVRLGEYPRYRALLGGMAYLSEGLRTDDSPRSPLEAEPAADLTAERFKGDAAVVDSGAERNGLAA